MPMLKSTGFKKKMRRNLTGWFFIAPAVIIFIIILFLPAIMAVYLSFTSYNVLTPAKFIGIKNYVRGFSDTYFFLSLKNVFKYVIMVVPSVVILSFLLAVLLNVKVRGIKAFRALFYLPCITSSVASAIVWKWLMNPSGGIINKILGYLGLPQPAWLNESKTALVSIAIICIWSALASNIMIYLAALQNIPLSLYESAKIDGAGSFQRMMKITLPLVSPTTFFIMTMVLIGSFQVFDQIYVLTSGGPAHATTVPMYMIYTNAFKELQMGYACAQAMILCVMIMAVTYIQRKFSKESLV